MSSSTDRIEKRTILKAPLARVWRAISDAKEFGTWFGIVFEGPFVAGARAVGKIRPTQVDPGVAKLQEEHRDKAFEWTIERIDPMRRLSLRWHPFAVEQGYDYSKEPTTLVVFELEEVPGGVQLTITESGFDRIPLERRAAAFTANNDGWTHQLKLIEKYLAAAE